MQVTSSYRDVWKIATPVIIGSLAMTVLNITDTAFLGRIGETELGASAVGGILYFAFAMCGISIGIGAQIMIARRCGEKNDSAVGDIFDHSLIMLSIIGLALFILLFLFSKYLLNLILVSEELKVATTDFLIYRSIGLPFIMLGAVFRSFYVGIANSRIYGFYSFFMAAVNMLLGYLLIFGEGGFPKMGIAGAGIASSSAEFLAFLFILIYTLLKKGLKKYRLFRFVNFRKQMCSDIWVLSAPIVVQNFLSMGSWFLFFVFIEKIGKHELAISNIVRGVYMIGMTPIWGFAIATNSMVSNVIGQGRPEDVFTLMGRIMRLAIMVAIFMITINLVFTSPLLALFTNDVLLHRDSVSPLYIVDLSMIFFAFGVIGINAVSGTGATHKALRIEIAAILIYLVYNFFFTFILESSIEVLWMSEGIYWLFIGTASYYFIRSHRWQTIKV